MSGAYLIQSHVLKDMKDAYTSGTLDADMALCKTLRDKVTSLTELYYYCAIICYVTVTPNNKAIGLKII